MAGAANAVTAACNAVGGEQPSQEQMAAFQQAYVRILAEQKALLQQVRPPPYALRPTPYALRP